MKIIVTDPQVLSSAPGYCSSVFRKADDRASEKYGSKIEFACLFRSRSRWIFSTELVEWKGSSWHWLLGSDGAYIRGETWPADLLGIEINEDTLGKVTRIVRPKTMMLTRKWWDHSSFSEIRIGGRHVSNER